MKLVEIVERDGRHGKYDSIGAALEMVADHVCQDLCKRPEEYQGKYADPDECFWRLEREECMYCPVRLLR